MPHLEFPSVYRDQLKKDYEGAEHLICPRCRNGHTVRGNYRGMCDFCCLQCLEGADDMVVMKMLTQEEADQLVRLIKEANSKWLK